MGARSQGVPADDELGAVGDPELDLGGQADVEVEVELSGAARDVGEQGGVKREGGDEAQRGADSFELLTRAHPNDSS